MSISPDSLNVAKESQSTGTFQVFSGNAYIDGARHRGWFVGHFLEQIDDLRATPLIEVKWSVYHAGEEKPLWSFSRTATTLCMLIKGNITIWFPMTEYILSHEGDYVIWPAGIPHRWMITEESLVLTIRWPSIAGDY
jgi:quercetin dioxygenase-like cupin family protein